MDFLNIIATLRKFGNFLAGLFPALAGLANRLVQFSRLGKLADWLEKLRNRPPFNAIVPIIDRFLWKDYARDRLDVEQLSPEIVFILKIVAMLSICLIVLMPLSTVLPFPAIQITLTSGAMTKAPTYCLIAWFIAMAFGWGCLSLGGAISNRWALGLSTIGCFYFLGTCALFLPRSYSNAILPFEIFLILAISRFYMPMKNWLEGLGSALVFILAGIPAGISLAALTPLHAYVKPHTAQWGSFIGASVAIAILFLFKNRATAVEKTRSKSILLHLGLVSFSAFAFLLSLTIRGGFSPVGDQIISGLKLLNGYIWPVWYYIGIGIIFKLLKNARIISKAVQDLLPKKTFLPLAVLALTTGTLIFWSQSIAMAFFPPSPLAPLSAAFLPIYRYFRPFLNDPSNIFIGEWMRWIFPANFFALFWLIRKKQLNDETAGSLVYFTLLAWFFIAEYTFQLTSFSRTPHHSALLVTLFAVWLLWLFHTSILEICSRSSKGWPAIGRQLLYCGLVSLCLLQISARTTVQDFNVSNEIFLMMFRGIIDVGIPYFLYVFATRRLTELPVKVLRLFQVFCIGAALTFPLNVLDKMSLSGGSISGLLALWKAELEMYNSIGVITTYMPHLPFIWLVVRSLVFTAVMSALAVTSQKYLRGRAASYSSTVFLLIAFAGGFASFSKTIVDLPLPNDWRVLIAPLTLSVYLDYYWLTAYLAAFISATIMALLLPGPNTKKSLRRLSLFCAILMAFLSNLAVASLFPGQEYELLSAELLPTAAGSGVAILVYLSFVLWARVQDDLKTAGTVSPDSTATSLSAPLAGILDVPAAGTGIADAPAATELTGVPTAKLVLDPALAKPESVPNTRSPIVTIKELHIAALLSVIVLLCASLWQLNQARMLPQVVRSLGRTIDMPAHWSPSPEQAPASKASHFVSAGEAQMNAILEVGTLAPDPRGAEQQLAEIANKIKLQKTLPNFELGRKETWHMPVGNLPSCLYTYTLRMGATDMPMAGITVMVPRPGAASEYYSIYCLPSEMPRRASDLRRILRNLR